MESIADLYYSHDGDDYAEMSNTIWPSRDRGPKPEVDPEEEEVDE